MNEYLIEAKKVLELIPLIERYNSKYRKWGEYPKHISFILKMIEKSGWSFAKACSFLKMKDAPPIEQQFRMFKKGMKTSHEPWEELKKNQSLEQRLNDFIPEQNCWVTPPIKETVKKETVKKVLVVEGVIYRTEILNESSPEFHTLISEILDGKHPKLKIVIKNVE